MEIYEIQPFTGEGVEIIWELVRSESRGPEFQAAWQKIEKDVNHFSESAPILDFNEVTLDIMTLEILAYPILLEEAQRPLKSGESKNILAQIQLALEQLKTLKENLKQLKKQEPDLAEPLLPFFEKLKSNYQEMRHQWEKYKKDWEAFQIEEESEEESEIESVKEKIEEVPNFDHVGWQTLQLCFKTLFAELEYRIKWKKEIETKEQISQYPLFPILIEEIQTIHAKTQGFELLARAQLTQKRSQQLAQKLQFLYGPDPILPQKEKAVRDTSEPTEEAKTKGALLSKKKKKVWLWVSLLGLGFLGLVLLTLLSQPPDKKQSKPFQSQISSSKSVPRKQPFSFLSGQMEQSDQSKKSLESAQQIVRSKGLKIPVYAPNESMKKLFAAEEVTTETLRSITKEAKELTALFVDEEDAYLVSGESLLHFDSLEKLKNFFAQVVEQYEQVVKVADVLQKELSQYQISVSLPEANGQGGYGLVLRDKNDRVVGQIEISADVLKLQWEAITNNLVIRNAQELVKVIQAIETSQ